MGGALRPGTVAVSVISAVALSGCAGQPPEVRACESKGRILAVRRDVNEVPDATTPAASFVTPLGPGDRLPDATLTAELLDDLRRALSR